MTARDHIIFSFKVILIEANDSSLEMDQKLLEKV